MVVVCLVNHFSWLYENHIRTRRVYFGEFDRKFMEALERKSFPLDLFYKFQADIYDYMREEKDCFELFCLENKMELGKLEFPQLILHNKENQSPPKYLVGKFLGKGEFGTVRSITTMNNNHNINLAVKIIHYSFKPRLSRRILKETSVMKLFREKKNIGYLKDHIIDERKAIEYLIMPCFTDGTLKEFISNHYPNGLLEGHNVKLFVHLLGELISIIEVLNEKQVIHRDFKPENIIMQERHGEEYDLMLVDFGFAREINLERKGRRRSTLLGTLEYMANEILNQIELKNELEFLKFDLFSLGITLFYLAFGRTPWKLDLKQKNLMEFQNSIVQCEFKENLEYYKKKINNHNIYRIIFGLIEKNNCNRLDLHQVKEIFASIEI